MSATNSLMSTFIEESPTIVVDHDAHAAQLDLVNKIPDGDHNGMPVVHVTEPTTPVLPSTSPEPDSFTRPSTANSLPEESYLQRRARYRSAVEVRLIYSLSRIFNFNCFNRHAPPVGSQTSLLTLSIVETRQHLQELFMKVLLSLIPIQSQRLPPWHPIRRDPCPLRHLVYQPPPFRNWVFLYLQSLHHCLRRILARHLQVVHFCLRIISSYVMPKVSMYYRLFLPRHFNPMPS